MRKAGNEFDALEWRPLQFFAERVSVIDHHICSHFLDAFDRIWPRGSGDHLKLGQLLHELYHDRTYTASAPTTRSEAYKTCDSQRISSVDDHRTIQSLRSEGLPLRKRYIQLFLPSCSSSVHSSSFCSYNFDTLQSPLRNRITQPQIAQRVQIEIWQRLIPSASCL